MSYLESYPSAVYCLSDFRAPWGFHVDDSAVAKFHLTLEGGAVVVLDGGERANLEPGELIALLDFDPLFSDGKVIGYTTAFKRKHIDASPHALSIASRTADAALATPTRNGFDGPARPSASTRCLSSTMTARVVVPPPSTPATRRRLNCGERRASSPTPVLVAVRRSERTSPSARLFTGFNFRCARRYNGN